MNSQRIVRRAMPYIALTIVFYAVYLASVGRLNTPTILVLLGMLGMCQLIRWLA